MPAVVRYNTWCRLVDDSRVPQWACLNIHHWCDNQTTDPHKQTHKENSSLHKFATKGYCCTINSCPDCLYRTRWLLLASSVLLHTHYQCWPLGKWSVFTLSSQPSSLCSAIFVGLTVVSNRQTHTHTDHATCVATGLVSALYTCDVAYEPVGTEMYSANGATNPVWRNDIITKVRNKR